MFKFSISSLLSISRKVPEYRVSSAMLQRRLKSVKAANTAARLVFEALRGFREWEAFEDLDFARRMRSLGKTRLLSPGVVSSARRFERRGPWRQTLSDSWQTLRYWWRE